MNDVIFEVFTRNGVKHSVTVDRDYNDNDYYSLTFETKNVDDIAPAVEIVKVRYKGAYIFSVSFCVVTGCTILFRLPKEVQE